MMSAGRCAPQPAEPRQTEHTVVFFVWLGFFSHIRAEKSKLSCVYFIVQQHKLYRRKT